MVWHFTSCELIKKIEKIQKRCLRIVFDDYDSDYDSDYDLYLIHPQFYRYQKLHHFPLLVLHLLEVCIYQKIMVLQFQWFDIFSVKVFKVVFFLISL